MPSAHGPQGSDFPLRTQVATKAQASPSHPTEGGGRSLSTVGRTNKCRHVRDKLLKSCLPISLSTKSGAGSVALQSPKPPPACLSHLIVPWERTVGKHTDRTLMESSTDGDREVGNMRLSWQEDKHPQRI